MSKTIFICLNYLLLSTASVIVSYMVKPPALPEVPDPIVQIKTFEDSVAHYIHRMEFEHPHIVMAQAKLESANFSSKVFRNNNNMFGMRFPRQRETVAIKDVGGYSYYETWQHSIIDLRLYYAFYLDGKTEQQVYAFLRKRYAEDPNYVTVLQNMIARERLKEKFKILVLNDNLVRL